MVPSEQCCAMNSTRTRHHLCQCLSTAVGLTPAIKSKKELVPKGCKKEQLYTNTVKTKHIQTPHVRAVWTCLDIQYVILP